MSQGSTTEKVLIYVIATFLAISVAFAIYVMFVSQYDPARTIAFGTILGGLLSLVTAILGVSAASTLTKRSENGNGGRNGSGNGK